MSSVIESLERAQLRSVPVFQAGDRVRVHFQVIEGTRRRTQVFEGVVIKRQGHGARETFTVRKQSFGIGVERTFPLHSPKIEKIEVAARGDVRRAKLYYLRDRVGKAARVRERRYTGPERAAVAAASPTEQLEAEAAAEPEATDAAGEVAQSTVAEAVEAAQATEAAEDAAAAAAGASDAPEAAGDAPAEDAARDQAPEADPSAADAEPPGDEADQSEAGGADDRSS